MKALLMGGAFAAMTVGTAIAQPAPPTPPGVAQGTAPLRLPRERLCLRVPSGRSTCR